MTPLLVSLHGLGRTYDWLMGYQGLLNVLQGGDHSQNKEHMKKFTDFFSIVRKQY